MAVGETRIDHVACKIIGLGISAQIVLRFLVAADEDDAIIEAGHRLSSPLLLVGGVDPGVIKNEIGSAAVSGRTHRLGSGSGCGAVLLIILIITTGNQRE